MLRHVLIRSAAALAAFGSALALTLVVSPSAATAAPATCRPSYPNTVQTTTSLRLARTIGTYGSTNVAFVRVSSDAGTPTGVVTLAVSNGSTYRLTLNGGGNASRRLPQSLAGRATYTVAAIYAGSGCYRASVSAPKFYTVKQNRTHIRGLRATSVRAGGRPVVSGRVSADNGAVMGGHVTVKLFHHGLKRATTATVRNGAFSVRFGAVRSTGTWTAKVTRGGTRNYASASGATTFRVTGR